nr:parathymosin-like [Dermacentor andersoni]
MQNLSALVGAGAGPPARLYVGSNDERTTTTRPVGHLVAEAACLSVTSGYDKKHRKRKSRRGRGKKGAVVEGDDDDEEVAAEEAAEEKGAMSGTTGDEGDDEDEEKEKEVGRKEDKMEQD